MENNFNTHSTGKQESVASIKISRTDPKIKFV